MADERPSDTVCDRAVVRKLSEDQISDLVARYRGGASVYDLGKRYGIHRATAAAHLHREGVKVRGASMTASEVDAATALYEQQGWSTERIGRHLDFNGGTIWLALRARGVRLRDPHGRER